MDSVNFKVTKPQIVSKQFVKNSQGNYVLSYAVSNAKINGTNLPKPMPSHGATPSAWKKLFNRMSQATKRKPVPTGAPPANNTQYSTGRNVVRQQQQLQRTVPLTNKTRVMNVLNGKRC